MSKLNDLKQTLKKALDDTQSPAGARGVSVAVVTETENESFVLGRTQEGPSFQSDSLFPVYSITKTFIAVVALRLVASGELALDVPIARWLPDAPNSALITLRHLLQHTSGLRDYGALLEYHKQVQQGAEPWTKNDYLKHTQAKRLLFKPEQGWAYSNIGYMLVGQLLETVRQTRLADLLQIELFLPLSFQTAFMPNTQQDLQRLIFGPSAYLGGAGKPVSVSENYHPHWVSHGVIAATAGDVARFYHQLFSGALLPPVLLHEMCQPARLNPPRRSPWIQPGYGLGLQIERGLAIGPIYGHSGGGPGASASACSLPRRKTVVVLSDGEDVPQVEQMALLIMKNETI